MSARAAVRLVCAASVVLSTGCGRGTCREPTEEGPGVTGGLTYVRGDGRSVSDGLKARFDVTSTSIHLEGAFTDADGEARGYTLELRDLVSGRANDLEGHGQICFSRSTGGEAVCAGVSGTIAVRALGADCSDPVQGVYTCAETIDATLDLRSEWDGTTLTMMAAFSESGRWVEVECSD